MVLPHDYMHPFTMVSNDNLPISSQVSIQAIVRCLTSTASQVSGKVTTLPYNGKMSAALQSRHPLKIIYLGE